MKIGPSLAIESVARSGPDGPHHPSPEPMNKLTLPLLVTLGVATAPAFATQATWTTMGSGNAMDMSADGTAVSGSLAAMRSSGPRPADRSTSARATVAPSPSMDPSSAAT